MSANGNPPRACGLGQLTRPSSFSFYTCRTGTMTPITWRSSETAPHVLKYETGPGRWCNQCTGLTSPITQLGIKSWMQWLHLWVQHPQAGWEGEPGKLSGSCWLWSAQHSKSGRNTERPCFSKGEGKDPLLHTDTVTPAGSFSLPVSVTYAHKIVNSLTKYR